MRRLLAVGKDDHGRRSARMPTAHKGDHFGDVTEMILDSVATIETGQPGLFDNNHISL